MKSEEHLLISYHHDKGSKRGELEILSDDPGIEDKVCLTDPPSLKKVRKSMRKSNAIIPSTHVETFGVTLIDVIPTGLLVIATNKCGPAEFINDQVGTLVPSVNEDALGHTMYKTFTKRQTWSEVDCSIHEYTADRFSGPVAAKQPLDDYRSALQTRGRCQ